MIILHTNSYLPTCITIPQHIILSKSHAHIIRQRSSSLWGGQALVSQKEERKSSGEGIIPSGRAPRKKSYAGRPRS